MGSLPTLMCPGAAGTVTGSRYLQEAGGMVTGARGAAMVVGAEQVSIHGDTYRVAADIAELASLSAHADVDELSDWLVPLKNQLPKAVSITHGEQTAVSALRDRVVKYLGINAVIPKDRQKRTLE